VQVLLELSYRYEDFSPASSEVAKILRNQAIFEIRGLKAQTANRHLVVSPSDHPQQ